MMRESMLSCGLTWKSMSERKNARGHRGGAKTDWLISIPGWRGWKTPLTLGYCLSRFQRYEN